MDEATHASQSQHHDAPRELWPPTFETAIFDFDGTISNTADLWHEVDLAFLGERGLPYTPDYARKLSVLGFEDGARYTIERYGLKESPQDICDEWNRMGRALYRTRATLRPGAEKYLAALRKHGVKLALATTNDPEVVGSMQHVHVDELFDSCVYGKEVARNKEHPDIYLEAARRLDTAPNRCIVFEDIVPGLLSAKRAHMLTCGVFSNDPTQHVREVQKAADLFLWDWTDLILD